MKTKITKALLIIITIVPAVVLFFLVNSKTYAADCSSPNAFSIKSVTAEQMIGGVPKVMPGEDIKVTIKNNCDTNSIKYNIYIHPDSVDVGAMKSEVFEPKYGKVTGSKVYPLEINTNTIKIDGNEPGKFIIRVVGSLLNADGTTKMFLGTHNSNLTIASQGIEIGPEDNKTIVKDTSVNFKIKFFGHGGKTFSIWVNDKVKYPENIIIPTDDYVYDGFTWNTAGTSPDKYQIIVKLNNNGGQKAFDVTVTDPENPVDGTGTTTGGSGFILTKLNDYNIKKLLNSCPVSGDLNRITCAIDLVITWLLDIGAVISFIMILYASIFYLTSYGDESKAELAKKTLIWSVIGVIVLGAAGAIMTIINNYLNK